MNQAIKENYQLWKKWKRNVDVRKLPYNLKKIQKRHFMQQSNLQKGKDLATLLEEKIAERKFISLGSR